MKQPTDLTQGSIFQGLWIMAVPLISASFIQMAYSMTDMLWLGHLGTSSVAAAGAAGFFTWLCNAFSLLTKIGAEITVSQSIGAKDLKRANIYANQAIKVSVLVAFIYACFILFFAPRLIGLFSFEADVSEQAISYMRLVAPGLFCQFNNNTFSGLYNGQGDSKTPFRIAAVGLGVNIILDPLLIYGYGPFPAWGTAGAAVATALSQLIVFCIFSRKIFSNKFPLGQMKLFSAMNKQFAGKIAQLGLPVSVENAMFSIFSLTLATLAARWGAVGVATQSIGSQIEAISWMTAAGFSTALASFTGQNYGAQNYERIRKGYRLTLRIACSFGAVAAVLFWIFNKEIFNIFVTEEAAIQAGGEYLKILALSQLFMVMEAVTAGAFNGCGNTTPPALVSIIFTGARIPMAYWLTTFPALGLNGIWWSVTLSSIIKGTVLPLWFVYFQRTRLMLSKNKPNP